MKTCDKDLAGSRVSGSYFGQLCREQADSYHVLSFEESISAGMLKLSLRDLFIYFILILGCEIEIKIFINVSRNPLPFVHVVYLYNDCSLFSPRVLSDSLNQTHILSEMYSLISLP